MTNTRIIQRVFNMYRKRCLKCKNGTYRDKSVYGEWAEKFSCNKCGHMVPWNLSKLDIERYKGE